MIKIEKYNNQKIYMTPAATLATPESVKRDNPAVEHFPFIVETDESGQVMFALQNFAAVRSGLGIDPALSEQEAIAEIERIRNIPPPLPDPAPSAEERIAAAMEFQNLMSF